MQQLPGRVAVVTGAASGLGRAMAERFAAEGMHLALADIELEGLREVAAQLTDGGTEVITERVDVASAEDVERLADVAFERFGRVHVLCNNAGVTKRARTWALTVDDWRWVIDVDLWSVIHGVRLFVPRMIDQGEGGHVVNTASMAGLLAIPGLAAYGVAKSGVVSLSETLALDLAAEGIDIGVSVLCPGWIPTRIGESERNRPTELGATAAPPTSPRTSAGVEATMTAEDVAGHVVDAITTERFWILTHQAYREVIQSRAAAIGTDAQPEAPPIL